MQAALETNVSADSISANTTINQSQHTSNQQSNTPGSSESRAKEVSLEQTLLGRWLNGDVSGPDVCGTPRLATLAVQKAKQVSGASIQDTKMMFGWDVQDVNKTGALRFSYSTVSRREQLKCRLRREIHARPA